MVSINIGAGQGVTQAIRDAIGAKILRIKTCQAGKSYGRS